MNKYNYLKWFLPQFFYIFFTLFISIKFIFIFFLRAAYEPDPIFELTPLYLFNGINESQLIFTALIVLIFGTYLHIRITKRNLILSFIPTLILLSGIGIKLTTMNLNIMDPSHIIYLTIFILLIMVLLTTHRNILDYTEKQTIFEDKTETDKKNIERLFITNEKQRKIYPTINTPSPQKKIPSFSALFSKIKKPKIKTSTKKNIPLRSEKTFKIFKAKDTIVSKIDFERTQILFDELERKTEKLEKIENQIEKRRKNLLEEEKIFTDTIFSISTNKNKINKENKKHAMLTKDEIDAIKNPAIILHRGKIKTINESFANLLGLNKKDIINKDFLKYVSSDSYLDIENYYLNKLRRKKIFTFKTNLIIKNNEKKSVNVETIPTIFKGVIAELAVFKI